MNGVCKHKDMGSIPRIHIEIELGSVYLQPQHWKVGLGLIEIDR